MHFNHERIIDNNANARDTPRHIHPFHPFNLNGCDYMAICDYLAHMCFMHVECIAVCAVLSMCK